MHILGVIALSWSGLIVVGTLIVGPILARNREALENEDQVRRAVPQTLGYAEFELSESGKATE